MTCGNNRNLEECNRRIYENLIDSDTRLSAGGPFSNPQNGTLCLFGHMSVSHIGDIALSEAISSLGCRCNSSSGSVLITQLTELQLMTCSRSVELLM